MVDDSEREPAAPVPDGGDEAAADGDDPSLVRPPRSRGPQPGIALCLSGGGSRAMLFHAGAILRLAETGLLAELRMVSSVSGGSITAGALARAWAGRPVPGPAEIRSMVIEPLLDLARRFVDIPAFVLGTMLPGQSPGRRFAGALDGHLYHGLALGDLPADPTFVFNATNLGSGALWTFTRDAVGDYLVGSGPRPELRVADAVAASSAFPPFFAPFRLGFDPSAGWRTSGRLGRAEYRTRVDLADGGVYDNLGLETAWKAFRTVLVSDGGGAYGETPRPPSDPVRLTLRVTQTIDHQVRSLRRRQIMAGFNRTPRSREGAYWGIGTAIADYRVDLPIAVDQRVADGLAAVGTHMRGLPPGTARRLVNWGYVVSDAAIRRYVRDDGPEPRLPFPAVPLRG